MPSADHCKKHKGITLREGSPEFELFIAQTELLQGGHLGHGASHLANLLALDPGRSEWVALLESYLAASQPDPELLIPRHGKQLYYATEAMRAYIWYKKGKLGDAIDLLVNVVDAKKDARYLEVWGLKWLEVAGAVESLPAQVAWTLFSKVMIRFPEAYCATLSQVSYLKRWLALCERYSANHTMAKSGHLLMLRAGLFRRAAEFAQGEALVRAAHALEPSWYTGMALALLLRQQGKCQEADDAFQLCLQLDPEDVSAYLEAGDMYCDREMWEKAVKWYEGVLQKQPSHKWALPSSIYCRWKLTGNQKLRDHLLSLAGTLNRANSLCAREFAGLPEPSDATANVLREFRKSILAGDKEKAPTGEAEIDLTCLEAPSNFLAFEMEMKALGHALSIRVNCASVPTPDPRQPVIPVKYQLWRYENGTKPSPGLPPPPTDVVQKVAKIASSRYDVQENWALASRLAAELGPQRVGEILSVMVHPPDVPPGTHSLAWLPRVQLAACQIVAHLDDGWDGSVRKEALMSVLLGPSDWTTEAAIRVLVYLALENEVLSPKIGDAFQLLASYLPKTGACCWEVTLWRSLLRLPHLFSQEREAISARLKAMGEGVDEEEEVEAEATDSEEEEEN